MGEMPLRVLVVDDDRNILRILIAGLESFDCTVIQAASAAAAGAMTTRAMATRRIAGSCAATGPSRESRPRSKARPRRDQVARYPPRFSL